MSKKAVCLLSGGLDSAVTAAMAKAQGFDIYAISFDYGQRHSIELSSAKKVAEAIGVKGHLTASVDLGAIGGSALTDNIAVPKGAPDQTPSSTKIPVTYVPARNTVFLSLALAYAETLETGDIFIGVNALDYSGYPDCRPEYIEAFEKMANLATKQSVESDAKVSIHAPLIKMTKKEIVEIGQKLKVDFSLTWSCYDPTPNGAPCGMCDSCRLRCKGFDEANVIDTAKTSK